MNISKEVIDYVHNVAAQFPGLNADTSHPGYRDELDAYRHAYMSALLTRYFGADLEGSKGVGVNFPYEPNPHATNTVQTTSLPHGIT